MKYDLVVVGGGPAGLAAAYEAYNNGIENVPKIVEIAINIPLITNFLVLLLFLLNSIFSPTPYSFNFLILLFFLSTFHILILYH